MKPNIYTFGNEFEYLGNQYGIFLKRMAGHIQLLDENKNIVFVDGEAKLSGITAEFLTNIIGENRIGFHNYIMPKGDRAWRVEIGVDGIDIKYDNETPSQFFLRVAVDRGYIDKSLTNLNNATHPKPTLAGREAARGSGLLLLQGDSQRQSPLRFPRRGGRESPHRQTAGDKQGDF